jgi:formylglycine-generating enzyme required for sulfatase activity
MPSSAYGSRLFSPRLSRLAAVSLLTGLLACDGEEDPEAYTTGDTSADAEQDASDSLPEGFVRIEPGTFLMGTAGIDSGEMQHAVTLTRAFLLQTTEVTQGQYEAVMGVNPSASDACGMDCPVESVTWLRAVNFANALSRAAGLPECYDSTGAIIDGWTPYDCQGYRLPTEAEWEYAARAGTTTATYAGDLTEQACEDKTLLPIAWFCGNSERDIHSVGLKLPNAWGLYDMLGNVSEWTNDWYGPYPGNALDPASLTDPVGPTTGISRVFRGGGWSSTAGTARAAVRLRYEVEFPNAQSVALGFRLARTLP